MQVRAALRNEEVSYVHQARPLGTGDAVLCAREALSEFNGRVLVVWSTQPTIRVETIRRTLKIALLFEEYEMVVPTTLMNFPYAPLQRDERGHVKGSHETHLQMLERPPFGETNIGLFVLNSKPLFETLTALRTRYWDDSRQCYERPAGELGFPNELINSLSSQQNGVFACAIAQSDEEQGIKQLNDVGRCEEIILRYGDRDHP
jgi:bifunctional N-acetylglucosamine-1-phosphate-uridyltransferase/glucosamine-1-phosphate-acetyltransferase GlmU-like protein